ncbi:MAG TPA: glutathione S-transferase family protein [Xanthomonadaceae bacterium]|nr:glutathione S-transferase family protein [Xanthomonadaceae bacterium]
MPTLVIGTRNYSSWSLRPWLLLRHFGIPFDEHRLVLDTPAFAAEIGRWSPTRRVPVLHDDGLVVWDSLAICEYANERWLGGRGWPADLRARAMARAAAAEMHSGFTALRGQLPMHVRRKPDRYRWDDAAQRDIDRVQQLWRELRAAHGAGGEFLCGEFGIVDAMFAPIAWRFLGYGVEMDANAARYVEALMALPAMREWRAASEAETEGSPGTDALVRG